MRRAAVLLAGLLAVSTACLAAGGARPHIVLVTLDTTRADHLGAWGWAPARTPNLDALAGRGTRFARCDTVAPITLVSHASLLTGLYPPRHGVRDNGTFALAPRVETITEELRAAGYDTAAVVSAVVLARRHGLAQGFRLYDDDMGAGYASGQNEESERRADATTDVALQALQTLQPPFFLWVHYYDPHEEYRPPTAFADAARGPHRLYDGEIAFVDQQLGRLLAALPAATDVAVVGDHGEMLGEQGELTHGLLLGHGVRRVPLLLAGPGVPASATEQCLVRTVDLAPTLLQLAGVVPRAGLDGRSLLPLPSQGGGCDRTSYSESFLPFFAYKWYPLRALSDGNFLYLQAPQPSLFHIAADLEEAHDLAPGQAYSAKRWGERLAQLVQGMGESMTPQVAAENVLSGEQRAQLQSLGYVSGSGGQVRADLPDPRAMTTVARTLHEAAKEIQEGKCPQALPDLQKIVQQDPHNFPALELAGQCVQNAGRQQDALALFQRAARENELSAVPVANIAGVYLELGRKDDAEREYRKALALDATQPQAASNLARLLRGKGDRAGAVAVLDGAIAAGSHDPAVYMERGTALAEAGRLDDALRDFREAARRNPTDPVPLENAARAAFHLGRTAEAAQTYEALLRLAPDRGDVWKTLGAIYLDELERPADAERCFRRALQLESDPAERAKIEDVLKELAGG